MIQKFFHSLCVNGPLGTAWRICAATQGRFGNVAVCKNLCLSIQSVLSGIQVSLDGRFDKRHGTDTSGVIPLRDLEIKSRNVGEGTWYEPMSVRVFRQIMDHLVVDLGKYEFVDFGSGKGRVLLLAWEYGFRRVTGVEFAPELHRVSAANIAILARDGRKRSKVETVCMDATEFAIPQAPVVLFFYSPFKGQVMERVLRNVLASFAACPREMALVFYGDNAQSIDLFKATKWPYKELALHADWSRFTNYRGFIFASPPV